MPYNYAWAVEDADAALNYGQVRLYDKLSTLSRDILFHFSLCYMFLDSLIDNGTAFKSVPERKILVRPFFF